jgi:hypothetical protein
VAAANKLLADVDLNEPSWSAMSVDKKTMTGTWYRTEEGVDTHSFRVIGIVKDVPFIDLVAVLLELDLFKEWFPMCCDSQDLGGVAMLERCATFTIGLPFPMANREVAVHGYGIEDLENKRAFIQATSMHGSVGPIPYPEPKKGIVRMEIIRGGWIFEALSPNTVKVSFIMNVDPKMKVPTSVLNFVAGRTMWVLAHQLEKAAKKAGKPTGVYAERRAGDKKVIYDTLIERIAKIQW